jgi:Ca2+-binding RTX toxin-like protein
MKSGRGFLPWRRLLVGLAVGASTFAMSVGSSPTPVSAAPGEVLILADTVRGGASSTLAQKFALAGKTPVVVSTTTWSSMSAAQFDAYDAIVLGDPACAGVRPEVAEANSSVWSSVVDGNVVIIGTDETYHENQGGAELMEKAAAFSVAESGKTGAYISLSCYYHDTGPGTPVPLLNGFGSFTATGVGCFNDAHIVATHPALDGLTDDTLSNWSCSVHEAFDSWPISFEVLVIAEGIGAAYTAPDGSVGTPYILARGVSVISDIDLTPVAETNPVGTSHTVTATVTTDDPIPGSPVVGTTVTFSVVDGPHAGTTGTATTNSGGQATFSYTGTSTGTDTIEATFVDGLGRTQRSNRVTKTWESGLPPDEADTDEDVPVEIFVLTNDPPPSGVGLWEITTVTQPANGTVVINDEVDPEVEDTVIFTPALNFFGSTSFTYTADDGEGLTATYTVLVTVGPINDEPVVSTGADQSTVEGTAVAVSGSATDVDGPFPLSYHWVILDGPEVTVEPNGTFADEHSPTTEFTPKQDGIYTLQLEACDADGLCDTDPADDTVTVTVGNVAPAVTLPADRTVPAGASTSVNVSFTDPGTDDTHTATIDWGDSSAATTVDPATSPFTVTHTFATTGTRTVEVCVSDGVEETCKSMTITVVNPTVLSIGDAAIAEPDSGTAPMTFTITATPTPTAPATVVVKTVNGSATAPSDYTALPAAGQTVTFAAGQATRTVTVPIVGDLLREANESFTVTLSGPVGATIGDSSGLGRIRNNDECTILGTAAGETLNGTAGNDVICGLGGNDTINGAAGNDTILAGDGIDTVRGGTGNDIIRGHGGDDVITGEAGNDVIDGGAGIDEASWAGAPSVVTVDLTANTATGWGTDTLALLERARGTSFNDTLRGNGLANMLWGGDGNDTLLGRSANDRLEGQNGDDTLRGEAGNDTALGAGGNDRIDGGAGVDLVKGDAGNDVVKGGAGNDNSPDGTTAGVHGGTGTNTVNGGLGTDWCTRASGDTRTSCERP